MAHWDFIRWLLYPVMFRVNSVFAWSVIQDEKGGQALELLFFLFIFLGVFLLWRGSTLAVDDLWSVREIGTAYHLS